MLNGFRRIGQSNFVLVTFISMHNLWKCSIPSTVSPVKCVCVFIIIIIIFIRAKGELNRPVNVMSISQTFTQGFSPSHLRQGHGNSREIPDTTLSMAHKTHIRTGTLRQTESLRGSLSNDVSDGNGNESGKTAIYRINKQNNFASASHFLFFSFFVYLYFIFIFLRDYAVNIPKSNDFLFLN